MSDRIFDKLVALRGDSAALVATMSRTAARLIGSPSSTDTDVARHSTEGNHPAMLPGKIQSGKTRAFIGIIAKTFDEGLDFAIILTKGTNALSEQTIKRVSAAFREAILAERVLVFDIMHLPKNLTNYHLKQKWIIVAKKAKNNLVRIFKALETMYPDLQQKRLLIIDDEADYASLTYKKNAGICLPGQGWQPQPGCRSDPSR
jgi:primosomal protein N'